MGIRHVTIDFRLSRKKQDEEGECVEVIDVELRFLSSVEELGWLVARVTGSCGCVLCVLNPCSVCVEFKGA